MKPTDYDMMPGTTDREKFNALVDRFARHLRKLAMEHFDRNSVSPAARPPEAVADESLRVAVAGACNFHKRWDPDNALAFAGEILTDANLHDERAALDDCAGAASVKSRNYELIDQRNELIAALKGARNSMRKAMPYLPPDNVAIYVGEWLDQINDALDKQGVARE